ncbi:hypothetical protein [Ensifer adhaerens]|uniref:STAND family AAA ATPase n=1 Tax=Ensifer adhaerens TaxID=106592 RepID=UPI001135F4A1|nr:hypothetical protein [Ensifer adhaerens]MDF8357568.1 hypothetical protein [Ensifer adhaerens]THA61034.1 hypothetical protein E5176_27220 [Ensifer adhaerens]
MFHHPFDWLNESDRTAVEARLHSEFSAFFFGHVHSTVPSYTKGPLGGAVYSQAGCLYETRSYFNGYSIVELDLESQQVSIEAREYSDRIRAFNAAVGAIPGGEVRFDYPFFKGANGDNLMALLATVRPVIKRLGDEHVRLADEAGAVVLDKHFIPPPLTKPKRVSDYDKPEGEDQDDTGEYSIKDLLESDANCIILGRPEAGKTTLIHYMALRLVTDVPSVPRLPLRAKFYDFSKGNNAIWRAIRAYANEISDGKITPRMIQNLPLVIFVDEVVQGDDEQLAFLLSLIKDSKNIRWVLVANGYSQLANVSAENEKKLKEFTTVSINELSRSSIRKMSAQWAGDEVDGEATNQLFNKVMEHIARSGLPRSGYIVSLILWTFRNGMAGELINEAVLLENIIDHMLGKMEYRGALRSEFDYTSKVAVLQELAVFLRGKPRSLSKNELVTHVISFLQRKGLRYDGSKIVEGLISCGILLEIDDQAEFRYRRFEEYFTSGYLRDHREKFEKIISADTWRDYAREMDLYTSRFRSEAYLLNEGRKKVDSVEIPVPRLDGDALYKYWAMVVISPVQQSA